MFYFKGCTKCQGDLTLEQDNYGSFLKCLQCGTYTEVKEVEGNQSVLRAGIQAGINKAGVKKAGAGASRKARDKTAVAA